MNSLNSILLEGNLTADPKLTITKNEKSVLNFSIATNRYFKKNNEQIKDTSFFDVVVWNGLAETCNVYLKKGRGVRVVGRLDQHKWIDNDGNNHSDIIVIAEHVEFKPIITKT